MRNYCKSVFMVFVTASLFFVQTAGAKDSLVMGVHPFKPAIELHKMFKPIADHISQKVGKPVELQVGKSYEDTAEKVANGQFDFSYMGPNTYAKYSQRYHFKPLAQIINNGKPTFHGVLVVKRGSDIQSIKDIKEKTFAFGDRNSTLTHVVPLYMLMNEGLHLSNLKKYAFLGSHDNIALNIISGSFDVAGLMPDIAEKYKDRGLEIIATSPELPEHVFAATKTMDPEMFKTIQDALLSVDLTLLKGIKGSLTGMQKVNDKDFDILRKILDKVEKELEK